MDFYSFITKHWAIVAWFLTLSFGVAGYLIKQWRDVEALKQDNIKCEQDRVKTNTKIDDYHIAAVAREEKIRLEVSAQIDKVKIKVMEDMNTLEREMKTELKTISTSIQEMTKILVEIQIHNQTANKAIEALAHGQKQQEHATTEFFRDYGGLLPKLKDI